MGRPVSDISRRANATAACACAFAALATSATGCSFLFSQGAPDDHARRATFSCGDNYAPPIVDTVFAGLLAYAAVNAAQGEDANVAMYVPEDQAARRRQINVAIGTSVLGAALDAVSAAYGYQATTSCQDAEKDHATALARARLLPPPYGVAPYGEPPRFWPPPPASYPPSAAPVAPSAAAPAPAAPEAPPATAPPVSAPVSQ